MVVINPQELPDIPAEHTILPEEEHTGGRNRIVEEIEMLIPADHWSDAIGEHDPLLRNSPPGTKPNTYSTYDGKQVVDIPTTLWVGYLYGIKSVVDEQGVAHIKYLPLEDVEKIHRHLAGTVLRGENPRVATLATPPHPHQGALSTENNDLWLDMIHRGQWPVMLTTSYSGREEYDSHDYADYHLANMMLFPKELQGLITETVVYEKRQRQFWSQDREKNPKVMKLSGEGDTDPYASAERGQTMYTDGISKIDNLTDVQLYLKLLTYLVDGQNEPVEERLKQVKNANPKEEDVNMPVTYPSWGYEELKGVVADAVNFNSRHRDEQQAVQELVDWEFEKVIDGVIRVAKKIRGEIQE